MPVIFCLLAVLIYAVLLIALTNGWKKYPRFIPSASGKQVKISVIVPFRNEASHIGHLIHCLEAQKYPENLFEIILCDDHSDDGSEIISASAAQKGRNIRYFRNDEKSTGKKATLMNGISHSDNELIVSTDADCCMEPEWLHHIARFYETCRPDIIIGLVDIRSNGKFMDRYEETDFLGIVASGAASASIQKPIYCNGACWAFKKELYLSLADPLNQHAVSGDDTFFLHAAKKAGSKIRLLKSPEARVTTSTSRSFRKFLNQRLRWASKGSLYRDRDILVTGIIVISANLALIMSVIMLVSGYHRWLFPVLFLLKVLPDYCLISGFMQFYNKRLSFLPFIVHSLMYPFITLGIALAANFSKFEWKGRHYRR